MIRPAKQGTKHQARTCSLQSLGALESEHRGNDDQPGNQRHTGIKKLDLVDGFVQVYMGLYVGAVGNHNPHGNAEGEEQLAHSIQ